MADLLQFKNRVSETTSSVGTGDIVLGGATDSNHVTFASKYADGARMPVVIFGGGQFWAGIATFNLGANSLARTTLKESSTGSNISFSAGSKTVIVSWLASTIFDTQEFKTFTDAATVTPDMATFINAKWTLGASRILAAPTNCVEGQSGTIQIIQDGTGSRLVTFNAAYNFGDNGTPTLSTGASKIDLVSYLVIDATTPVLRCSFNKAA